MGNYIVKLINGSHFSITEEEYKAFLKQKDSKFAFFKSNSQTIQTASISQIMPEHEYNLELRENRTKSMNGILHDGTKAIRHFGQWFLDDGTYVDDPKTSKTRPEKLIDPVYYPEVARECVPTIQEYQEKYAQITDTKERLQAILSIQERPELDSGIKKLL